MEYAGAFQLRTTYVLSVSEARIPDGAPGGFPSATNTHTHTLQIHVIHAVCLQQIAFCFINVLDSIPIYLELGLHNNTYKCVSLKVKTHLPHHHGKTQHRVFLQVFWLQEDKNNIITNHQVRNHDFSFIPKHITTAVAFDRSVTKG